MNKISKIKIGSNTYNIGGQLPDMSAFAKVAATLSQAPDADTLSNGTYTYIPGDTVRVADLTADTGYIFYRLYAVTDGTAKWAKLDEGELSCPETVTVLFSTNVNSNADLINNATVTATYSGLSVTKTFTGTEVLFEIPLDVEYTLTYGSVTNYTTPVSYTRTSVAMARPIISAQYNTCQISILVTCDRESLNGQTVNVVVDNVSYPFSITNSSIDTLVLRFAPGTGNHTLTMQEKAGYRVTGDTSISKVAGTYTATLNYIYGILGVSVYTNTGLCVKISDWNSNNNANAIGLALVTENYQFVIKKDSGYIPTYIRFTASESNTKVALGENNYTDGQDNSLRFYNAGLTPDADGDYAGRYCARVNANKVTINNTDVYTYVGALNEVIAYLENYKAIIDAYNATGIDCRSMVVTTGHYLFIASSTDSAKNVGVAYTSTTYKNIANGTTYTVSTRTNTKYSDSLNNNSTKKIGSIAFLPFI